MLRVRRGVPLLAVLATIFLAGCLTAGYVVQAGLGQLRLWGKARPISEVLVDPAVDARTKALLAEVPDILGHARKNGLADKGNYREYVELDQPSVVWFMAASDPLGFEPKVWSFPIVGSFTYVGWFNYDEARTIKRILVDRGLDVHVRQVRAYSTGGWFDDPILSSMLSPEEDAFRGLVHVLIHELVHANILINDQSTFNESVASFVGDTMTAEYLIRRLGPEAPDVVAFREDLAEREKRSARMAKAYSELATLYDSSASKPDKLAKKLAILKQLEVDLQLSYTVNNASLLNFKTYNAGMAEFGQLYRACDEDWHRFFAAVRSLKTSSFSEEQQDDIAPVIGALAAKGCPPAKAGKTARGSAGEQDRPGPAGPLAAPRPTPRSDRKIPARISSRSRSNRLVGSGCRTRLYKVANASM